MRFHHTSLSFLLATLAILFQVVIDGRSAEKSPIPNETKQIILVTTPDWNSVSGTLRQFAKGKDGGAWHLTGKEIPIVVGRSGLAWGRGLHPTNDLSGPIKKEGDGKSPAGIYKLSSAFGREAFETVNFIQLPYQQLLAPIECVDDVKSHVYNQIVDRNTTKVDWNSSEKMRDVGEQYRLGVVVDHNVSPREPGAGSCIFLHIWKNQSTGTSGCTAMEGEQMEQLLHWLDAKKHPVLVQLPEAQYEQLKSQWNLPSTH